MKRKRYSPEQIIRKLREVDRLLSAGENDRILLLIFPRGGNVILRLGEHVIHRPARMSSSGSYGEPIR
jgi:hypothetical protein